MLTFQAFSTLRQASVDEGSLNAQTAKLKNYVKYENDNSEDEWKVIKVYREEGKSGKDTNRPQFQKMMEDIETGLINTVICYKLDRVTRSVRDFYNLWEAFENYNVQFISLNEKFDTSTAIGRAMLKQILVFAELEREQTGERTSAVMNHRAEQGLWNGGHVIGYSLDPEETGSLLPDPKYSKIIKNIYKLYCQKGSTNKVVEELRKKGYCTPEYESRRGKKHGGKPFNKQVVLRILQNPVYLGKVKWGGTFHDGNHKPIIDKNLFDEVQTILNQNRKVKKSIYRETEYTYLLQGILRCGGCGSMMTPKAGTGRNRTYYYYHCTKSIHEGKEACSTKSAPAEQLDEFIINRLKELALSEDAIQIIINEANKNSKDILSDLTSDKSRITERLAKVQEKIDALVDTIEDGGKKAFRSVQKRLEDLEREQEELETELDNIEFDKARVESETLSVHTMVEAFKSLPQIIDSAKNDPEALKDLCAQFIQVIEWHQDKETHPNGHLKIAYFEEALPRNKKRPANPVVNKVHRAVLSGSPKATLVTKTLSGQNT